MPNNQYGDTGPGWYEINPDARTFTIHYHDGVQMYWHDGVPVTMYDVVYAIELIAHPDVSSPRFGPALNTSTIVGIPEYRENPSVGISGLRVFNNGRSLEYTFESVNPSMLFGGIWTSPLPKHRFEGIPHAEVREHPYSRSDIVGNGPFMFERMVPGESVSFIANPNFWLGAPKLDRIIMSTIDPALIGEAMLAGTFDIAEFPVGSLPDYEDRLTNVTFVSALARMFSFMGFRFGFFDHDEQSITLNPDTIVNCIALRQALMYGRDDITVATTVFNDLRFPLATTMIPWQGDFMREDMVGYSIFDQELANKLLDDAGYEWREGEQFRRHKDTGEFFEITWAVHNNATNPILALHHMQDWHDIGLNVQLWGGGIMDFNDRIQMQTYDLDEGALHMFDAAWNFGSNPNPRGLWGATAHNDPRYTSPNFERIFNNI
jgi:peptide/nickel transport system substrate-binding protein